MVFYYVQFLFFRSRFIATFKYYWSVSIFQLIYAEQSNILSHVLLWLITEYKFLNYENYSLFCINYNPLYITTFRIFLHISLQEQVDVHIYRSLRELHPSLVTTELIFFPNFMQDAITFLKGKQRRKRNLKTLWPRQS